jgi:crotonobetainyl-CoA:carnitine CoA-transferase CaiB-like acyl-CoA transferase
MQRKPLENTRVIEIGQMLTGPMAGMHLADLGADVIKIENPDGGDVVRPVGAKKDGISEYFGTLNRNKRFVSLNLASEEGTEIFQQLIQDTDVVIENLKAGMMEEFGLSYEELTEMNPNLIYCSIKGFGENSPYRGTPAFDFLIQALSGTMSITGKKDGVPLRTNVPIGDIAAAMYAKESILASLLNRYHTDSGDLIEISMLDTLISWLNLRIAHSQASGEPYPRNGNDHENFAPYTTYEAEDGYIAIAIATDNIWPKFCDAIDRQDLVDNERFETNQDRIENKDSLNETLALTIKNRTTDEWFDIMQEHGVPAAPIYDTIEMWEDPHIKNRDLLSLINDIPVMKYPVLFSETEVESKPEEFIEPKVLGADNPNILTELGYSDQDLKELSENGVI